MRGHPVDPRALAEILADEETPADFLLEEIREDPDLYYVDHLMASDLRGVLPLTATAWRRACLSSRGRP